MLKRLWPSPLLLAGCIVSYLYWPASIAFVALLLSLFLFLPLVIVSLNDFRRARNLESQPAFWEMNLPPPRRLFVGPIADAFDRIADLVVTLEGLGLLVTFIAGVGVLGYVGLSWLIYFVGHAQYFAAGVAAVFGLLAVGAAIARIPAALIVVFGGAAISGTAFLSGYGSALLP